MLSYSLKYFLFASLLFNILALKSESIQSLQDSLDYYKQTNYSKSIEIGLRLKNIAQHQKNDTLLANTTLSIGIATYLAGKHDEALKLYLESIQLFSSIHLPSGVARAYNELGILYMKQRKYAKAKQVLYEAISILKSADTEEIKATSHNNLGLVYEYEKKLDSAEYHLKKAYSIYEKSNNLLGMSYSLDYLSGIYIKSDKLNEAKLNLEKSLAIRQQLQDKTGIAIALNNLGEVALTQQNYAEALKFFTAAGDSARLLKFIDLEAHTYKMKAELYEKLNDYKHAFQAFQKYNEIQTIIADEKRIKNIEEFEAKYETGKKEKEIIQQKLQLSKRRNLLISLVALLIFTLFSFYSIYTRYKNKQEKLLQEELLKAEEKRAKAILESEENERQRLARELHDGIGQLLTATKLNLNTLSESITAENDKKNFENSLEILDDSIREIRVISHNMMPAVLMQSGLIRAVEDFIQKINQTKKITIHFEASGLEEHRMDETQKLMLFRIIQESVTNTLKYAEATNLSIQISADENEITVMIEDNGKGFDIDEVNKKGGIGLKNIRLRTEYLKGKLDIDSTPNGTTTIIEIPLS